MKSKKIANPEYKELESAFALATKTRDAKKTIVIKTESKVSVAKKEMEKLSRQWEKAQEKLSLLIDQFYSSNDEFGSANDECRELLEQLKTTPKYIEED